MRLPAYVRPCLALTLLLTTSVAAGGRQTAPQKPAGLDRYESQATDSVEVTIDDKVLRLAARALSDSKPDEKAIKALLAGLKSVYVRAFRFERDGAFEPAEVDALRTRFSGPEWSRIVGVRSRKYGDNVDVYLASGGELIKGLGVVVSAPRELIYVHVSGDIDLERLRELEGRFNLPRLELYRAGRSF